MSRAADVYSFAMIMWELFACKRLYEGHIASQVRRSGSGTGYTDSHSCCACYPSCLSKRPAYASALKSSALALGFQGVMRPGAFMLAPCRTKPVRVCTGKTSPQRA